MLKNIIQKLFGTPAVQTDRAAVAPANIAEPYAFLDAMQRGLAQRAQMYVETGEGREVLADLQAAVGASQSFNPQRLYFKSTTAMQLLVCAMGGKPAALARYAELRQAMGWGISRLTSKTFAHCDAIPDVVLVLLECSFNSFTSPSDPPTSPTTWDDLRESVKALGGQDIDIVLYCLPIQRYGGRLIHLGLGAQGAVYDQFDALLFAQALERLDAKGRALVLERWAKMSFVAESDFLPFLFQQGHESSATLRKNAAALFPQHDPEAVCVRATDMLTAKKASARLFAVEALGVLDTPEALKQLAAHKETETSQSVLRILEVLVGAPEAKTSVPTVESGYIDVNGAHVPLPPQVPVVDDGSSPLDASFVQKFHAIEIKLGQDAEVEHARRIEYWTKRGKENKAPQKTVSKPLGERWLEILNTPVVAAPSDPRSRRYIPHDYADQIHAIIEPVLDEIPLRRIIDLACGDAARLSSILKRGYDPLCRHVQQAIADGRISFAQFVQIAQKNNVEHESNAYGGPRTLEQFEIGYLQFELSKKQWYLSGDGPAPGIWQIAASRMDAVISALPPRGTDLGNAQRALAVIADFPSLPADLVRPLLFVAIDERARLRDPAQNLLADAPGIDEQLIAMLADKRQTVRANAARFLADRGTKAALPALIKRLKTEKSELARADFISAVKRLGGETKAYLGRDALMKEAQALVAKLPDAKLAWLDQSSAPHLQWADGSTADPVVLDAWLRLALKLKSPMGSPLFGLYFDQMTADSATAVSDWILNSWITYDADRSLSPQFLASMEARAQHEAAQMSKIGFHVGNTVDDILARYLRNRVANYHNSGTDSKGILALTHRATPSIAGAMIAGYLKQHGKRVPQAKALVETLYGMGSQDAVQVLVATSTRLKQRSVRELAEKLVADVAETRGWTQDQLADRSVPTGGFEDDGTLSLDIGTEAKPYVARLASDLSVKLFNPQGKEVKALPAGTDANTKEAKSLLSTAKKTVKMAQAQQQARLYDAMVSGRVWDRQAWQDDLTRHPIMQRLIERMIWRGLDASGELITGLRMTPEGELLNAAGDDVDMTSIAQIDVAHTANVPDADRQMWLDHFKDFEVKPLFAQMSRPVRHLTDAQKNDTRLAEREGWMMTAFKLRAAAKKVGYERAPIGDGGGFDAYRKEFRGAQIRADLYFTGSNVPEDDIAVGLKYMQFTPMNDRGSRALALTDVPALLLSEVWNDLQEIAKSGAFDADWERKSEY